MLSRLDPLVLDLSGVDFLTAEGLGELIRVHKRLQRMGGELVLDNVGEQAFEVLQVTRLTDVLKVRRTQPTAEDLPLPKA
jgi:anti-anti-sigma factor